MKKILSVVITPVIASNLFSFSISAESYATFLSPEIIYSQLNDSDSATLSLIAAQLGADSGLELMENILSRISSYDANNIYDLNGDEVLDYADAMVVLNFLHGSIQYYYDYSELDGDGDGKIDTDDAYAYLSYYTHVSIGIIDDECILTHNANSYSPESLSFRKYNATTGAYISSYILPSASALPFAGETVISNRPNTFDNDISPASGINTIGSIPSRMPNTNIIYSGIQSSDVYPSGIIKMQMYTGAGFSSESLGTGFVIDNHTIATVAHALYNSSYATTLNCNVKNKKLMLFAENGTALQTVTITPVEYHVPLKFIQGYVDGYDFALVTVEENLEDYCSLTLGLPLTEFINSGATVYNTGTPSDLAGTNGNDNTHHLIVTAGGSIYDFDFSDPKHKIIAAECPATASGAPLYYPSNEAVLGIVRAGIAFGGDYIYSASNTIRSEMLKFYYNNPNISY